MNLSQIPRPKGSKKKRKIVGRGESSGHGKTSGRGHKGACARAGRVHWIGFEGGQMPLFRRLPKRGFNNSTHKEFQVVNLGSLEKFEALSEITPELLKRSGLIKSLHLPVKVLAEGEITKPLHLKIHACSQKAQEKIKKLEGKIEFINA